MVNPSSEGVINDSVQNSPTWNIIVYVNINGRTIPTSISPDATVKDLKSLSQALTDVPPDSQELVAEGKVLVDDDKTLRSLGIADECEVMFNALHQTDIPMVNEAKARSYHWKVILNRWMMTGVTAFPEINAKDIPGLVWKCGSFARLLDASHNHIEELPAKIKCLKSLERILLNNNELVENKISWEGLMSLRHLKHLNLSVNKLMVLPPAICLLGSLKELHVASNLLTSLPKRIGLLNELQILVVSNNRISTVPSSIGECRALVKIDLSENLIAELPETISNLKDLEALHLNNNGLKSIPCTIFKECTRLSTLDLHNTEITFDILRQFEGWEDFDRRAAQKIGFSTNTVPTSSSSSTLNSQ